MKKEKIITRTVTTLNVAVLGFNSENNPEKRSFTIPEMEEKNIVKYLASTVDNFTPCKVVSVDKVETLYGMEESTFIKYARILPPRKVYEKEEG